MQVAEPDGAVDGDTSTSFKGFLITTGPDTNTQERGRGPTPTPPSYRRTHTDSSRAICVQKKGGKNVSQGAARERQ